MTDETPTTPMPEPPPPPRQRPPLIRSRTDRILGGVGAGLARTLDLDPLVVRIAIAVLTVLTGGAGALLYAGAWLLLPAEAAVEGAPGAPERSTGRTLLAIAAVVVGLCIILPGGILFGWAIVPLGVVALIGLGTWWLVAGVPRERTARGVLLAIVLGLTVLGLAFVLFLGGIIAVAGGGKVVIAAVVLAAGAGIAVAAFLRPVRWLILPAIALALGAGTAAAAGAEDVGSSAGERVYRPTTPAQIRPSYELGAGHLVIDLRDADLRGRQDLEIDLGTGVAEVLVAPDVCVASDLHAGVGAAQVFDLEAGGIDVDREDGARAPSGTPLLHVRGDVGFGLLRIGHTPNDRTNGWEDWRDHEDIRDSSDASGNAACIGGDRAQG